MWKGCIIKVMDPAVQHILSAQRAPVHAKLEFLIFLGGQLMIIFCACNIGSFFGGGDQICRMITATALSAGAVNPFQWQDHLPHELSSLLWFQAPIRHFLASPVEQWPGGVVTLLWETDTILPNDRISIYSEEHKRVLRTW